MALAIQDAMTAFENNMRHDRRSVELSVEELRGVPDDFLVTHPIDETSGKINVFGNSADTGLILDYCQVQATREKAACLLGNTASPINEAVLKRLLDLRREKAKQICVVTLIGPSINSKVPWRKRAIQFLPP